MYRGVILLGVFIATALAADEENLKKCYKLFNREKAHCCITMTADPEFTTDPDIKECYDLPDSASTCDIEVCVAKKLGYYGADGNLDIKLLTSFLEKKSKERQDQSLFVLMKEKCLNSDISKYGLPNMCDFKKMKHCLHIAFLKYCPEWSEEGDCNGLKKAAEECTANY